jgi:hypothetical protein
MLFFYRAGVGLLNNYPKNIIYAYHAANAEEMSTQAGQMRAILRPIGGLEDLQR